MSATNGGNSKAQFGTPAEVLKVCEDMQAAEKERALDRKNINLLANGHPPWSAEECLKHKIRYNVNWKGMKRLLLDAIGQVDNTDLHEGILFTCSLEDGPGDKRDEWSEKFTKFLHLPLQRGYSGKRRNELIHNRNTSLVVHGKGIIYFPTDDQLLGRFLPLEDLLMEADTYCDFSNLEYWAVNLYLSRGEFIEMTQGDKLHKGWDKPMADEILKANKERTGGEPYAGDREEAMAELAKNKGWNYSTGVPKIQLRAFYFKNHKTEKWHRHYLLREAMGNIDIKRFLFDGGEEAFAGSIDQILCVHYANGSVVAPMRFHSVRGLGVDLYEPCDALNKLYCREFENAMMELTMLLKVQSPGDRDKIKNIDLHNMAILEEGVNIVPAKDRYQANLPLVQDVKAQTRQIMQESSSSYVQDTAKKEGNPRTYGEARILLNQATMLLSGMINGKYMQDSYYYEELVRRSCQKNSGDKDVLAFQERCEEAGIPSKYLVADKWRVEPERVLGGGDHTQAQLESEWMVMHKSEFSPDKHSWIMRTAARGILRDDAKARFLSPDIPKKSTEGTQMAEQLFGTLMAGQECDLRDNIDFEGYVAKLLVMMQTFIQRVQQTGGAATWGELSGLMSVQQNITQYLIALAADEKKKPLVKQFAQKLAEFMQLIQKLASDLAEQQQMQEPQGDPAAAAKVAGVQAMAQTKQQIAEMNAEMKRRHAELKFALGEQIKSTQALADIQRKDLASHQTIMHDRAAKTLDLLHQSRAASIKEKASKAKT